ncbi:MAG: rhomboid family intramembrane serine protease [Candidatus Nanopelagicales bacterium]
MSEIATVVDEKRRSFWKPVVALVGVMWVVEILDLVLPGVWNEHGIVSRDLSGLLGIPLAPFLHDGLGHLVANTVPFLVLGLLVSWRAGRTFWPVLLTIVVASGLGVWLVGASGAVTVGASGVVFGFLTYLIVAGVVTKHFLDVLIGVLVLLVFGSLLWGVLPFVGPAQVSWQAHLFGALGGVLAALLFAVRPSRTT